jgi:MHS family citrate/tricarballylate:H+ symporter-like MFS transporter
MSPVAPASDASIHPPVTRTQVTAAVIGNALEFYDFTTYTVFAVAIVGAFFPNHKGFVGLMFSLMTFGVGFVTRPIGAIVLGRFGDRAGRKPALLLSFTLMGVAIVGLALTPGYAKIGVWAPILAVGFRLVQGFALGGELGPAMAFLIEAAAPQKRGLIGSWQSASQSVASLVGGLVAMGLALILAPALDQAFGWRIAFLIGALVLPFGLVIRRSLPETLHRDEAPESFHPADTRLVSHTRILIIGLAMIMAYTTITYVRLFMTTYAINTLHMSASDSYGGTVSNGLAGIVFTVLGGALSDRFGRKPVMIWPMIGFLLTTYPAFLLMVAHHDAATLWGGIFVISAFSSLSAGAALVALTESLRKEVRSVAMGTVYAVAVAAFGGVTQPLVLWLIHVTGQPMAPAVYMMATTVVGLIAMALIRETAPARNPAIASAAV